jgi:hypothetical protein
VPQPKKPPKAGVRFGKLPVHFSDDADNPPFQFFPFPVQHHAFARAQSIASFFHQAFQFAERIDDCLEGVIG